MGRDALTTWTVQGYKVIDEMCDLDKQTLLGLYEPFGAHGTAIYEFLKGNGLVSTNGKLTDFGNHVANMLRQSEYFGVDKPCDTE